MPTPNPSSLDALLTLLELERSGRDQALRGLRDAESAAQHARAQATTLADYRAEYAERWTARLRSSSTVELMQCYQGFLQRLDHAITQQRAVTEQALRLLERAVATLREREQRLGSVEKLIERRRRETHRDAARREQAITDEAAMRVHERRRLTRRDPNASGTDTVT